MRMINKIKDSKCDNCKHAMEIRGYGIHFVEFIKKYCCEGGFEISNWVITDCDRWKWREKK